MRIPVYANLTGRVYTDPKNTLAMQVNNPVLWRKSIENMISDGFGIFIELGPGKALSGLIKKINSNVLTLNVCDIESLNRVVSEVRHVAK